MLHPTGEAIESLARFCWRISPTGANNRALAIVTSLQFCFFSERFDE